MARKSRKKEAFLIPGDAGGQQLAQIASTYVLDEILTLNSGESQIHGLVYSYELDRLFILCETATNSRVIAVNPNNMSQRLGTYDFPADGDHVNAGGMIYRLGRGIQVPIIKQSNPNTLYLEVINGSTMALTSETSVATNRASYSWPQLHIITRNSQGLANMPGGAHVYVIAGNNVATDLYRFNTQGNYLMVDTINKGSAEAAALDFTSDPLSTDPNVSCTTIILAGTDGITTGPSWVSALRAPLSGVANAVPVQTVNLPSGYLVPRGAIGLLPDGTFWLGTRFSTAYGTLTNGTILHYPQIRATGIPTPEIVALPGSTDLNGRQHLGASNRQDGMIYILSADGYSAVSTINLSVNSVSEFQFPAYAGSNFVADPTSMTMNIATGMKYVSMIVGNPGVVMRFH